MLAGRLGGRMSEGGGGAAGPVQPSGGAASRARWPCPARLAVAARSSGCRRLQYASMTGR
eukprot:11892951-Alexandrium_andersonii.AAC.1